MQAAAPLLKDVFGFDAFRPGQEEIVDAVCQGENVLAIMPTGGGKSLCFQLPALIRDGVTVVISPLIALMRGGRRVTVLPQSVVRLAPTELSFRAISGVTSQRQVNLLLNERTPMPRVVEDLAAVIHQIDWFPA